MAAVDRRAFAAGIEGASVAGFLLGAVHIWGALRREQPWTETAEIPLYVGLGALALWIRLQL